MNEKLIVSSSPHIRDSVTVDNIMRDVVIALIPAVIASVYFFRVGAVKVMLAAVLGAVATEFVIQKLTNQQVTINDWSAVVTGLLLAFTLPSSAPVWIPVLGSVFAIAIVKQAFGGLGYNFMNPALAGRAFLVVSWGQIMTTWVPTKYTGPMGADVVTSPTPMGLLKEGVDPSALPSIMDTLIGNVGGSLGETSALLLLLGGAYLVYKKIISVRIPAIFIGTVAVLTLVFNGFDFNHMIFSVLSGGLMLGAIFMATDYASSPITKKGQIIFALGCGIITALIRVFGGYPEGVLFAILLMNVATPIIDKYAVPKVFGGAK